MGAPPKTVADQVAEQTANLFLDRLSKALATARGASFDFNNLEPPSNLYVGPDTWLRVEGISTLSTETLQITYRLMLVTGEIHIGKETLPLPTAGVFTTKVFPLAEGYLLSVMVANSVSTTQRGQLFASVALHQGPSATAGIDVAQLIQDYVDSFTAAFWPGGRAISSIEGPGAIGTNTPSNPAAGTDFSITVSAAQHWRLRALSALFTTSATVANRRPRLTFQDVASNFLFRAAPSIVQTASLAWRYSWGLGFGGEVLATADNVVAESIPDIILQPTSTVGPVTANIQAGDTWTFIAAQFEIWQAGG